ncbi:MAG: SDR family NAD(P)-dependent oxidoreductase [Phycisphaerae bacterium]|nr:SDR family NAD(P)-dependent oxidoreductase [Gemmatimonadaceae bacterium]
MSTSKHVVITGASGGIGAALALQLCRDGMRVAIVARRETELREVATQCGPNALPIVADVSDRETVADVVDEVIENFGHIDVWVNNVGRGINRLATEVTDDDIDEMMRINVKTALYGMQQVLPHFKERGVGHIINVSSMLGRIPMAPIRSVYSASKHFLNAFTANFREAVQTTHPNIQVSLVSPGIVATEFGNNALGGGPDSRTFPTAQSAETVAEVIAGVIGSRKADVYTVPGAQAGVVAYYSAER